MGMSEKCRKKNKNNKKHNNSINLLTSHRTDGGKIPKEKLSHFEVPRTFANRIHVASSFKIRKEPRLECLLNLAEVFIRKMSLQQFFSCHIHGKNVLSSAQSLLLKRKCSSRKLQAIFFSLFL